MQENAIFRVQKTFSQKSKKNSEKGLTSRDICAIIIKSLRQRAESGEIKMWTGVRVV